MHVLILLGVGFKLPKSEIERSTTRPLEIMVLRDAVPSEEKPLSPEAYAQIDRQGGGVEETPDTRPESPAPATPPASLALPLPLEEPSELIEPSPSVETTTLTAALQAEPEHERPSEPEEVPPPQTVQPAVTAAQILASRNLEIAELTARIEEKSNAFSKRARRKAISASTKEYKYANYLEAWRRKVERIGNLNYPEEAKRHKLYGSLILHAAVRADGSVEQVRVLRSSGFKVLDEAAVRIVKLAAPFAPFPPDIKSETDVLDITRTWQFLSSNRLGWDN
jgi:protein TonB